MTNSSGDLSQRKHSAWACGERLLGRRAQEGIGRNMARQGQSLSQDEVRKIILLLSETDMTIPEIATRMGCSRSAIASINRRCKVRLYNGLRSSWEKPTATLMPSSVHLPTGLR